MCKRCEVESRKRAKQGVEVSLTYEAWLNWENSRDIMRRWDNQITALRLGRAA